MGGAWSQLAFSVAETWASTSANSCCSPVNLVISDGRVLFSISQSALGPQRECNGCEGWVLDLGMTELSFWRWRDLYIVTWSTHSFLFISNTLIQSFLSVFNTFMFHLFHLY